MKRFLLLLLLVVAEVKAESVVGVSYLALQGYSHSQCVKALKVFQGIKRPALQILWGSFGDRTDCLDRFLKRRNAILAIHAFNETCFRLNRHCTAYDQPRVEKRIKEIARFVARYPSATFLISTGLEDDLSEAAYKKRARLIRRDMLQVLIVRNPNSETNYFNGADCVERHGLYPVDWFDATNNCRIYSNDGNNLYFGNGRTPNNQISTKSLLDTLRRERRDYDFAFIWWNTQGADRRFVEPRSRRFSLSSEDILSVNKLIRSFNHDMGI